MLTTRLALTLVLLPTLTLAAGCDKDAGDPKDGKDPIADSEGEAETDPTDGDGMTSTNESESESDGESDGTTGEPLPPPEPKPDPALPCPGLEYPFDMPCTTADGVEGTSVCVAVGDAEVWTECSVEVACTPGDNWDMGCIGEICAFDGEQLYLYSWSEPNCDTPLVLNFDGAPLRFEPAAAAAFDISGVGACLSTDWPTLPWLALDRDGDGEIASGRELFGSGTVLAAGGRASNGFAALAELDADRDGSITAADPAFAELVLWSDHDDDRRGELAELVPVSAVDLVAIHLDFDRHTECDDRGNCGRERARFEFRGPTGELRSGEVVDVYLACQ